MDDLDDDVLSPVVGRREILRTAASAAGLLGLAGFGLSKPLGAMTRNLVLPRKQMMCVLTPGETQGPYYLNLNLLRSDITEGLPGLATKLFIHVVQASTCLPVANAAVDVWHANAPGAYSGFGTTVGQTWLRGVQNTDPNGLAVFNTIYPGWYMGRTQHIHVKVRPTPTTELTTQLYFRQALNTWVNTLAPYSTHGQNPTTNASDMLFLNETVVSVLYRSTNTMFIELTIGVA